VRAPACLRVAPRAPDVCGAVRTTLSAREMKGFAFVEFIDSRDARDACDEMNRSMLDGRELQVLFAQVRGEHTLRSCVRRADARVWCRDCCCARCRCRSVARRPMR
jgi:RNA recognition motif-containing protein